MAAFLSFLLALYFLRAPLAPASSVVGALPETHSFFSTCASGETRRRVYEAMHTAADDNLAVRNEPIVASRAGGWSGRAAQRSAGHLQCRQGCVCVCVI